MHAYHTYTDVYTYTQSVTRIHTDKLTWIHKTYVCAHVCTMYIACTHAEDTGSFTYTHMHMLTQPVLVHTHIQMLETLTVYGFKVFPK